MNILTQITRHWTRWRGKRREPSIHFPPRPGRYFRRIRQVDCREEIGMGALFASREPDADEEIVAADPYATKPITRNIWSVFPTKPLRATKKLYHCEGPWEGQERA